MGGQGQPTPLPTQTHTQKAFKTLVFLLFDSCSRTDGRTKPLIELRDRNYLKGKQNVFFKLKKRD